MKPFRTCVVACAITSAAAMAQADYSANPPATSLTGAAAGARASSSAMKPGPRTSLYGGVMKGNAASDNTIDDLTKRGHLIDQQYLAGWGSNNLFNGAYNFEAIGFNWFGAGYGGATPDEVRFGLASPGKFAGGLMISLAKTSTEDSITGGTQKTKEVLRTDGFGAFGSFALGAIGDVYGEISAYTGFDTVTSNFADYSKIELGSATAENTPRIIHVMGGWKHDATTEGTHSLNAELILNLNTLEIKNPAPAATIENSITDIQLWFYHGYIMKDAGGFKVFAGSNTQLRFMDITTEAAPKDHSIIHLETTPNMSFQKDLSHGFETFAGAGVTLALESGTNVQNVDKMTQIATYGTDMSVGLRWVYENLAFEGAVNEVLLANGPNFVSGAAAGMFGQIGLTVGF